MNYTDDILKILSTELVPYSTVDGQACVDGVLTSAQKLNEFILQLLQQTPCTAQLPPSLGYIQKLIPVAKKELETIVDVIGHDAIVLTRLVAKVEEHLAAIA